MGVMMNGNGRSDESGSIELVVMGLLAALVVVLAFPLFSTIGGATKAGGDLSSENVVPAATKQ